MRCNALVELSAKLVQQLMVELKAFRSSDAAPKMVHSAKQIIRVTRHNGSVLYEPLC